MNSADVWHPEDNPEGDMAPVLKESIAIEEAKKRHPSAQLAPAAAHHTLTGADRCDTGGCNTAAVYRVMSRPTGLKRERVLDFCLHHHNNNFPTLLTRGWTIVGGNHGLLEEMGLEALAHAEEQ